ncbi:DUF4349 domain-containing protein [Sphingobacterium sp. HJSM2_6]|uniref:DUF4349 domain-containing protein n=1 Tax=Sphingobacterium sp. HJSM2_6 TaxID=3366264 RepID=UPI003BDF28AC
MKRRSILYALLLLSLVSCSSSNTSKDSNALSAEQAADAASPVHLNDYSESSAQETKTAAQEAPQPQQNPLKIIKQGNLSIESKDIKKSKHALDKTVQEYQAYYQEESSSNHEGFTSYQLTIRIPSNKFEPFIKQLEQWTDKLTEKSIRAEDVSIQYYDVESRLASKRAYLTRYQQMVKDAKSVKDLLEIQEQIRTLQEEIDSNEGVLKNLSGQVNYSTLSINLFEYQSNDRMGSNPFWVRAKESIGLGWTMVEHICLVLIGLWPAWIMLGLGIYLVKKIRTFRRKRNSKERN